MSNEPPFNLNDNVNKQNRLIWSESKAEPLHEMGLHPERSQL